MTFKELERRANHVFEPKGGAGPVFIVEIQAQRSGDVYDGLLLEIALYRKAHPGRTACGLVIFLESGCDEPASPWAACLERPAAAAGVPGRGAGGSRPAPARAPGGCLPLRARDAELAERAPAAWRRLEGLDEPGEQALLDVFMSWLMERHQGQTYGFTRVASLIGETRTYQQLVGISRAQGEKEGPPGRPPGRPSGRGPRKPEQELAGGPANCRSGRSLACKEPTPRVGSLGRTDFRRPRRADCSGRCRVNRER